MPHDWLSPWETSREPGGGEDDDFPSVVDIRSGERYDLYVGYPSEWHNPYRMKRSGFTRDKAVDSFIRYLCFQRHDLFERLPELAGKVLACFCGGLRCHGRVLAALATAPPPWLEVSAGRLVPRWREVA